MSVEINLIIILIQLRFDFASKTPKQAEKSLTNKKSISKSSKSANENLDDSKSKASAKLSSSKVSRKKIVSELENEDDE